MVEVIYGDASNIVLTAQKRLVRPVYGQTQLTPYAGLLDTNLRSESEGRGTIEAPKSSATKPFKRTVATFSYKNSIVPGTVFSFSEGEYLAPAAGIENERVAGLLGQWLGGEFDGVKGSNQISVWYGPGGVIDVLKPAFNEKGENSGTAEYMKIPATTITSLLSTRKTELEKGKKANTEAARVVVVPDVNSLLSAIKFSEVVEKKWEASVVGEVIELVNANVLRIKLLV